MNIYQAFQRTFNKNNATLVIMDNQNALLICIIFGIGIAGVIYWIASMRKGTISMNKPEHILSFTSDFPAEKVMKIIIQYANQSGYKVDDFDESKFIIVLSDPPTLMSMGFFYPIYLVQQNDGKTSIEIGIKGKIIQFQMGPVVNRYHEKCFNGIKTAIYSNNNA
jgi:hypothetical protein